MITRARSILAAVAALVAVLIMLTGCASKRQELPPLPHGMSDAPRGVVSPTKTGLLVWTCAGSNLTFNVYTSPVPSTVTMKLWTNTASKQLPIVFNRTMMFYGIKSRSSTGLEGAWGTTK